MKIGNLSCSVINVPDFFLLSKQPEDNVLQVPCPYQKFNVFREKDFFRFSPLASLNFNRNRKLQFPDSNYLYKTPTFEEIMGIEYEEKENVTESNKTNESFKKIAKTESNKKLYSTTKDILLKTNISHPSSVEEFSNTVRTNMNQLINKINQDIHNYDENVLTLKKRDFKIKRRFPVNEKSEDTRYKEAIDYTVDHLHLISPKIKYQINNRYSNILGRRDYNKMLSFIPHYQTEIPFIPERIEENEKIENEKEEVLE